MAGGTRGKLEAGARVEIAPYRGGRFFYSYAEYDGSRGVIVALKPPKARVRVLTGPPHRLGGVDVPREALKVLERGV